MLLNLAGVVFLDDLTDHLHARGFEGFTARTGWVIRSLGDEPCSLRDLADRMGLSSPGALKAIDPMVAHGFLERASTKDRRVRAVAVTEHGRAAIAEARAFHAMFEQQVADMIGEEAAAQTRLAMEALVERGSRSVPAVLVARQHTRAPETSIPAG